MDVLVVILLLAAVLSFGLAAASVASRVNLIALGLLFGALAVVIPAIKALAH